MFRLPTTIENQLMNVDFDYKWKQFMFATQKIKFYLRNRFVGSTNYFVGLRDWKMNPNWSMFDSKNNWWWINIDQLIFNQGCQTEIERKGRGRLFLYHTSTSDLSLSEYFLILKVKIPAPIVVICELLRTCSKLWQINWRQCQLKTIYLTNKN